nr:MAG TPA: hypothetical protein [Caudoviricetes sp.]
MGPRRRTVGNFALWIKRPERAFNRKRKKELNLHYINTCVRARVSI